MRSRSNPWQLLVATLLLCACGAAPPEDGPADFSHPLDAFSDLSTPRDLSTRDLLAGPDLADGAQPDLMPAIVRCADGMKDGIESDTDCGGSECARCADGKACGKGSDCRSGLCSAGACKAPSCSDGI